MKSSSNLDGQTCTRTLCVLYAFVCQILVVNNILCWLQIWLLLYYVHSIICEHTLCDPFCAIYKGLQLKSECVAFARDGRAPSCRRR